MTIPLLGNAAFADALLPRMFTGGQSGVTKQLSFVSKLTSIPEFTGQDSDTDGPEVIILSFVSEGSYVQGSERLVPVIAVHTFYHRDRIGKGAGGEGLRGSPPTSEYAPEVGIAIVLAGSMQLVFKFIRNFIEIFA